MLKCRNRFCDNVGVGYDIFEERLLAALWAWLGQYELESGDGPLAPDEAATARKALQRATAELETLQKQLTRTHELLERDVYDIDTFLDRSRALSGQIAEAKKGVEAAAALVYNVERTAESRKSLVPQVKRLLEVYAELPDAAAKNELLKEVLERVEYRRESRKGPRDAFELTLYPKLPSYGGAESPL